jgi:hypothetical protein
MRKFIVAIVVLAVVAVIAGSISPISPRAAVAILTAQQIKEGHAVAAPRTAAKASRLVIADGKKLAGDFAHKRYRAVCADLTAKARRHLGGTSGCMLKVALLNSLSPIKRFTIVKAEINRRHTQASVVVRINGSRKRAVFLWEARKYHLDHYVGKASL